MRLPHQFPKADTRLEEAMEVAEPRMTEAAKAGMAYVVAWEAEEVGRRAAGGGAMLDVSELM